MNEYVTLIHGGCGGECPASVCVCVWASESFFKRVHDVRYKITDTPRLEMETWSRQACWAPGCHKPRTREKPETSSRASSFLPNSPVLQLQADSPEALLAPTTCSSPTGYSLRKEMDPILSLNSGKRPPQGPHLFLSSVFPFICHQTLPPSSRGLLTCPWHQAVQKPLCPDTRSRQHSELTAAMDCTHYTSLTPSAPPGRRLSTRGVSDSAKLPAGPGPPLLQAAALPGTKGPKWLFLELLHPCLHLVSWPRVQVKLCDPASLYQLQSVLRYVAKASHSES